MGRPEVGPAWIGLGPSSWIMDSEGRVLIIDLRVMGGGELGVNAIFYGLVYSK